MYLADRVAFHVVATVATMFHVAPLEGKEIPKPQSITWSELVIQYATIIFYPVKGCFLMHSQ